jgi:hypothetical protein
MLETQAVAVGGEQLLDSGPSSALTDHAGSEAAVALAPSAHVPNRVHHFGVPQRKRLGQTRFENRPHLERESEQYLESALRAGFARTLQDLRDLIVVETWDDWRNRHRCVDPGVGENAESLEALARRTRERFDRSSVIVVHERNAHCHATAGATLQLLQHIDVSSH